MTSPFSEELISAYLDGELTAQEKAHVEKQLREDAGLRRMCDELRVLRVTLQSIPAEDLSQDLAERVLRQAERRMLLGEEEAAEAEPTSDGTVPAPAAPSQTVSPLAVAIPMRRNWRFIAGCVATAAALFLTVLFLLEPAQFAARTDTVAQSPSASSTEASLDQERDEQSLALASEIAHDAPSLPGQALTEESESVQDNAMLPEGSPELGLSRDAPRDAFFDGVLLRKQKRATGSAIPGSAIPGSAIPGPTIPGTVNAEPNPMEAAYGTTAQGAESFAAGSSSNAGATASRSARSQLKSRPSGGGAAPGSGPANIGAMGGRAGSDSAGSGMHSAAGSSSPAGMGGMRGGSGAALGKQRSDTDPSQPMSSAAAAYRESQQPGKSPLPSAPAARGLVAQDDAARTTVAQQLVQQLDTEQSLLVQVTLPRDLETRFREAALSPDETHQRLSAAAWELLDAEILPTVELKAASPRGEQQLRQEVNPGIENVILVNGERGDVRRLVQRLVGRSDIQVHNSPMTTGQSPYDPETKQPGASDSSSAPNPEEEGSEESPLAEGSLGGRGPAHGQSDSASQPMGPPPATNMRRRATDDRTSDIAATPTAPGTATGENGQPDADKVAKSGVGEKQFLKDKTALPPVAADSSEPATAPAGEMGPVTTQPRAVVYFLFRFKNGSTALATPETADAAQAPGQDK